MRLSAICLALACSTSAAAQTLILRPATATLDHEFTSIGALRELSDGRIVVSDAGERMLYLADLRSAAMTQIGRTGAGPGEFRDIGSLLALAGDTTMFADRANGRLAFVHGASIVRTELQADAGSAAIGPQLIGADANGNILSARGIGSADFSRPRVRQSRVVLRARRGAARADSIATIEDFEMAVQRSGPATNPNIRTMSVVFSVADQATVFPDGWIAIALQNPYRVDWYPPTAPVRRGAALEPAGAVVTEEVKQAWKKATEEFAGRPLPLPMEAFSWAERIPPFRMSALVPLPDGRLLVAKELWLGNPDTEYDVIDRRGIRVGKLQMTRHQAIVAATPRGLYVRTRDEDGIQRLSLHPLP